VIDKKVHDAELVNVVLRVIHIYWEPFVHDIYVRETVPWFYRIWNDCIQEETQLEFRDGLKRIHDENFSLAI
jgi:hypothetical protein